ncbi:MAG: response regulator [Betaproteobacteria bacterium]|nr:response regulator [Betaproteobacteria bacterium]
MRANHKVLVVDDDPVVGKSFNRVLSNKGYVVITAQNAQEALTKLQEGGYDAVFTDIRMPGMDGLELAERVKARTPWTPVVIVTGYGTAANEARARAAGVSAFLQKPLSPEMIEESALNAMRATEPVAFEPAVEPVVAAPAEAVEIRAVVKENLLKNIALFMLAPFIGLLYAVMLPFVGIGIVTSMAVKALVKKVPAAGRALTFLKNVGKFVAAPFVGLAFIILFPIIGAAMLAWFAVKGLMMKVRAV